MSKIKNSGLDQYDPEPFEQQQFGTAGVEGVNRVFLKTRKHRLGTLFHRRLRIYKKNSETQREALVEVSSKIDIDDWQIALRPRTKRQTERRTNRQADRVSSPLWLVG